jgi:hypothetical protein
MLCDERGETGALVCERRQLLLVPDLLFARPFLCAYSEYPTDSHAAAVSLELYA